MLRCERPRVSLCDLPDPLLARVLAALPCDDQARAAALSRRFAALVASDAACRVRLSFDCSRTVLHDDTRAALLRRAGAHLRELDLGPPHPGLRRQLHDALDSLSDAQRAQLTTLRCSRRAWEARALGAEPADAVLSALQRCPQLQLLSVDVALALFSHAEPHAEVTALLRSLPRLRVGRLIIHSFAGHLATYPPALLAALCACCAELCVAGGLNAADIAAVEAALPAGGAHPTLSISASVHGDAEVGVAALLRLAQHPRVVALAVDRLVDAAALGSFFDALRAPGCSVHALAFHSCAFDDAFVSHVSELLRSGAPLRRLALSGFWFAEQEEEEEEGHAQLTRLCAVLAKEACALEELALSSAAVTAGDAPALALLLRASRGLRSLDVSGCALGPDGVAALAAALSSPRATLQRLRVSDVRGSPGGAHALAAMLRVNASLRELHALGYSPPFHQGDNGEWTAHDSDVLLHALEHNTTLRAATLPDSLYADEQEEDVHGYATRQLRVLALHAEQPRAAEVCFGSASARPIWGELGAA
jgi:hypothetical protein